MISDSNKRSSDRLGRHARKICVWFFSVNYSDFPIYSRTLLCGGPLNSSSVTHMITFVSSDILYFTIPSPQRKLSNNICLWTPLGLFNGCAAG